MELWQRYEVVLEFNAPFAASLPKTPQEIRAMLAVRMPTSRPANPVPVEELVEQVVEEVGAAPEEERGWATFKRDEGGIYYEARCVRAHLKDCALQVAHILGVKALKAKVANRVYVEPEKLRLHRPTGELIREIDGTETRMIHVLTRLGPRNDIKQVDYIAPLSRLTFTLRVLRNEEVTAEVLKNILEYGSTHGMGQERSQDFGKYAVVSFREL